MVELRLRLILLVSLAGLIGCFSSAVVEHPAVEASTEVPPNFKDNTSIPDSLLFPQQMLYVSFVTRPRAEVREGPGVAFALKERVLGQGARVALMQRVGVWQKVLALDTSEAGWVHYKTLARATRNSETMVLRSALLPTLFAQRKIRKIYDFHTRRPISVDIPKGHRFLGLGWAGREVLVYLPRTHSVAWLRKEEAQ